MRLPRGSHGSLEGHIRRTAPNNAYHVNGPAGRTEGLKRITAGIRPANKVVWDTSKNDPALRGMVTTVAAVIIERSWMSAHVGDSRVYLIRAGVMTRLTENHSLIG